MVHQECDESNHFEDADQCLENDWQNLRDASCLNELYIKSLNWIRGIIILRSGAVVSISIHAKQLFVDTQNNQIFLI